MSRSKWTVLLLILSILYMNAAQQKELELRQLNVVFRHGDRAPEVFPNRFPNDPYMNASFFSAGSGGLLNVGKQRMYRLGEILRNRYSEFLAPAYENDNLFAVSSDTPRTKMSLQLVLAALYPPSLSQKQWKKGLDWRPIPFQYNAYNKDKFFNGDKCEIHVKELAKIRKSTEIQGRLQKYKNYLEDLRIKVGKPSPLTLNDILILHNNLDIENRMNLPLESWAKEVLADKRLEELRKLYYELHAFNNILKLQSGYLLQKIGESMIFKSNSTSDYKRKIALYSSHDKNIIGLLQLLEMYDSHFPEFSSALIFELLSENEQYYVKLNYYLGISEEIKTLKIPGCTELCPLDQFTKILKDKNVLDKELDCNIVGQSYFEDGD